MALKRVVSCSSVQPSEMMGWATLEAESAGGAASEAVEAARMVVVIAGFVFFLGGIVGMGWVRRD